MSSTPTTPGNVLARELAHYERNRDALLAAGKKGKHVLIQGERIVDVFDTSEAALARGYELFGNDPFLAREITDVETPVNFTSFSLSF